MSTLRERIEQIREAFWICFRPDFGGVDWDNDGAIQRFAFVVAPLLADTVPDTRCTYLFPDGVRCTLDDDLHRIHGRDEDGLAALVREAKAEGAREALDAIRVCYEYLGPDAFNIRDTDLHDVIAQIRADAEGGE